MVQIPSGLPLNSINSTVATASSPRSWAVGAILSATVTGPTVDQLLPLRIGGLDATAQSGLTLQAGTRLQLEVISNSPTITLRVLSATSNAQNSPVSAAMRLALPRQAGLPPLLANLNWLASQNPQQLPAAMRELAVSSQQLLTQLQAQATNNPYCKVFQMFSGWQHSHNNKFRKSSNPWPNLPVCYSAICPTHSYLSQIVLWRLNPAYISRANYNPWGTRICNLAPIWNRYWQNCAR